MAKLTEYEHTFDRRYELLEDIEPVDNNYKTDKNDCTSSKLLNITEIEAYLDDILID